MDANLKKYALVKGNLYYTYGKTHLTMFFRLHFKTFFYLCGVFAANKEWSEFEQKADREFEISVAYIAACNLSAFVPEQYFLFFSWQF